MLCALDQTVQFALSFLRIIKCFRKCAGMQFDELASDLRGGIDLFPVWRNKQAHVYAGVIHPFARFSKRLPVARGIQSTFGCYFAATFGNQAHDVRFDIQRDGNDFRRVGHLEVEPGFDLISQLMDIAIQDMPPVFAQMSGDAMRASSLAYQRGCDGIRFTHLASGVPRLPHSGYVIDINAEFQLDLFAKAALIRQTLRIDYRRILAVCQR